jgi:nucleoside-diphosphate-sugar epimerase
MIHLILLFFKILVSSLLGFMPDSVLIISSDESISPVSGNINNGELFHICGNEMHEIGYYLDLMLGMYGLTDVKLEVDPKLLRPIDIPVQYPSSEKVRKFLGWLPQIDINTTLKDLVEYWRCKCP